MRILALAFLFSFVLVQAADNSFAGTFTGEWKSNGEGGGAYNMTLQPTGGDWKADVTFNVAGEDVKAAVKNVRINGANLEITYTFATQGTELAGKASGELKGSQISGTYQSLVSEGGMVIDEGTWSATRK
ncbi:MAG TPA: hypothetical protein VG273_00085 [Bryobacteraceae bacterium]|jgi:hypothetical protein|nr:hypothetical protein [Bryobacteraceae bacterium]